MKFVLATIIVVVLMTFGVSVNGLKCYTYSCWDGECEQDSSETETECDISSSGCLRLTGILDGSDNNDKTDRAVGGCWKIDPTRPDLQVGVCLESEVSDNHPTKGEEVLFPATECICGKDLCNKPNEGDDDSNNASTKLILLLPVIVSYLFILCILC